MAYLFYTHYINTTEVSMSFSGNVKKLSQIVIFRVLTIKIRNLLEITAIILQKLS